MDVAGKMFTTTVYSNPLQLVYPDNPANRDWVHGSKTSNSFAYVYAYDNNGQIAFKFSDEAPDLSDHLRNTVKKPFLYKKYPNTAEGIYYRYVGGAYVNNLGLIANTDSLNEGVPAGTIMAWTSDTPPSGWLLCDGSAISRSAYANLFAIIGTTFGAGDGSATFNLPNLKGSVPVGYDADQIEFNALGETGGEKAHILTVNEMPTHTHTCAQAGGQAGLGGGGNPAVSSHSGPAGGGEAHNNMPPYITLNYIIKT